MKVSMSRQNCPSQRAFSLVELKGHSGFVETIFRVSENQAHFVRSAEDCQSRLIVERRIHHRPLIPIASSATLTGVRVEGKALLGSDLSVIADLEAGWGRLPPLPSFGSGFELNAINPGVGA